MNMMKNYNPKEYRRNNNMKGIKAILLLLVLIAVLIVNTGTVSAAVNGITKDNYTDWIKPNPDAYGYNIGECEREYLEGEEYFYNDYIDHWNVDKVYDASLIPGATTAKATTTKKATAKKAKKSNKTIVKTFCKKKFKGYKIKFIKEGKVPTIRKGKKCVYVEQVKTISKGGKWGQAKGGKVKYNKKVKKGKRVTVYLVWNPRNNAHDDVVAVICQGKIR